MREVGREGGRRRQEMDIERVGYLLDVGELVQFVNVTLIDQAEAACHYPKGRRGGELAACRKG